MKNSLRLESALLCAMFVASFGASVYALGPEAILLWPEGAPGAPGTEESDRPSIRIYAPPAEKSNGASVVMCPGGAYAILAYDHEGSQVAQWLNEHGVTGIVLQYRLHPKYRHPAPLNDAQRAILHVRANATMLKLSPTRIGVMGFSAGGHLASTVSTHFDAGQADAQDPIERVSCRPDFSVLCDPVIGLKAEFAHRGSAKNLLGDKADSAELLENLSNDTPVNGQTPPAFLFYTNEDKGVRVENALAYYAGCVKHDVPAELHVYQNGPHGVGLAAGEPGVGQWPDALLAWMKTNGFLFNGQRSEVSGSMTLNGKPLTWGSITLESENPNAPTAWSMVNGGKFSIPAIRGVPVGNCRVTVRDWGGLDPRPSIEKTEIINTLGIVFKVVAAAGQNTFDLNLETKTP